MELLLGVHKRPDDITTAKVESGRRTVKPAPVRFRYRRRNLALKLFVPPGILRKAEHLRDVS